MDKYYFLGIGGIGMSALARYFKSIGAKVAGYDLRESALTKELEQSGIWIHYTDDISELPQEFISKDTKIIYTPAIPKDHSELNFWIRNGNDMMKRSQALGEVTKKQKALCVAGTHGKTSTSTILAHIMNTSPLGANAFLGGISANYNSNLIISDDSEYVVVEADEFDRSFHRLSPFMSIITSTDPDHLDIYNDKESYLESFAHYTSLIDRDGALVVKKGLELKARLDRGEEEVPQYTYSIDEEADFYATNIRSENARLFFTWHYPTDKKPNSKNMASVDLEIGVPLLINVENAVASMGLAYLLGVEVSDLVRAIKTFKGVARRFEKIVDTDKYVYIDDYAHHPAELDASIKSIKYLYPEDRVLGIFQPHLYSRTNDFYREFAQSLMALDEVILLDIYPARELPMEGVSSEMIAEVMVELDPMKSVIVMKKEELLPYLEKQTELPRVILTLGAGDIDRLISPIKALLEQRN